MSRFSIQQENGNLLFPQNEFVVLSSWATAGRRRIDNQARKRFRPTWTC